jgi:hypothetical protein
MLLSMTFSAVTLVPSFPPIHPAFDAAIRSRIRAVRVRMIFRGEKKRFMNQSVMALPM